jgi:hypothetical protein
MSKVNAVTQDIMFAAKIASFRPINAKVLAEQFAAWIQERGQEHTFIVWVGGIELLQGQSGESK